MLPNSMTSCSTSPQSPPNPRSNMATSATASRKQPLASSVAVCSTTCRETWMSTRHSRLRAIASANSGAMKRRRDGAPQGEAGIDPAARDEGIGEQEQLVGEEQSERETHRPHVPPPRGLGIAPQVLGRQ